MRVCNIRGQQFVLVTAALMLLSGCFKHPSLECGPQEPCPDGYLCTDGVCEQEDPTEHGDTVWQGYNYLDADCREGYARARDNPFEYADLPACCEAHPDSLACARPCEDHADCDKTQLCEAGVCVSNGDCDTYFEGWYRDADGACVQGRKFGCQDPFFDSQSACEAVVDACPAEAFPDPAISAARSLTCEYGQECCCGQCYPSVVCEAEAGEGFGCFYTDACLVSICDACSTDADCPDDQVCSLDRDGQHLCVGGCRDDASCPAGTQCVQVECFTLPCAPQCVGSDQDAVECAPGVVCP